MRGLGSGQEGRWAGSAAVFGQWGAGAASGCWASDAVVGGRPVGWLAGLAWSSMQRDPAGGVGLFPVPCVLLVQCTYV